MLELKQFKMTNKSKMNNKPSPSFSLNSNRFLPTTFMIAIANKAFVYRTQVNHLTFKVW